MDHLCHHEKNKELTLEDIPVLDRLWRENDSGCSVILPVRQELGQEHTTDTTTDNYLLVQENYHLNSWLLDQRHATDNTPEHTPDDTFFLDQSSSEHQSVRSDDQSEQDLVGTLYDNQVSLYNFVMHLSDQLVLLEQRLQQSQSVTKDLSNKLALITSTSRPLESCPDIHTSESVECQPEESQYSQEQVHYNMMRYAGPPIRVLNKSNVLSIGGAGRSWATNYASTHPNASVKTINRAYEKCLQVLEDDSQDFVRITQLGALIKWAHLIPEVYRVLRPGCYLEVCDISKEFSGSNWLVASSVYKIDPEVWDSYNMIAKPVFGRDLARAGFEGIHRASSPKLTFDTEQGSKYMETVLSEMKLYELATKLIDEHALRKSCGDAGVIFHTAWARKHAGTINRLRAWTTRLKLRLGLGMLDACSKIG
ncbi:hypothetical protein VM1G_11242 [Cytospora mali]|nr:hypothetical protein VM1G_11242 [Valsa mali]